MTPLELIAECKRKQEASGKKSVGVYLVLPPRKITSYGNKVRLFGALGGPLGELVSDTNEHLVAIFPADKVIRWIERQRLVESP